MIVKLPWVVNLTSPKAGKQQKRKKLILYSNQNLSALENVLRTGAMAMLCTTETQIEEIWKKEKPEAQADAKGNIEKQHQCREITFLRRLKTSQRPVGLFELEFCSTGASVSFSSSLAGFAALC